MSLFDTHSRSRPALLLARPGAETLFLLSVTAVAAAIVFRDGAVLLATSWRQPEYAHGPLIPVISMMLLHRQIALDGGTFATRPRGTARIAGILAALAVILSLFGSVSGLLELSAYGIVVLAAALLVAALGWPASVRYWHPVVHLSFMLPLPGLLYYATTTTLQGISSEVGVMVIRLFDIPVVLTGNVIDMGTVKLLVAEACSGLRYMFPILSFSFVLAILYRGPTIKKLAIFAMAVPTAIAVNALRISAIGLGYGLYGIPPSEGLAHVLEGWVLFLVSIGLIVAAASALSPGGRLMFDTDFGSPRTELIKLRAAHATLPLRAVAAVAVLACVASALLPERSHRAIDRVPFSLMQDDVGAWSRRAPVALDRAVIDELAADDIYAATFAAPSAAAETELFVAYYADQREGGIHSPELCLPGAGWEIEALDRIAIGAADGTATPAMRAVIRRDLERRVVIYWFDQHGRRTATDYLAKLLLVWDGVRHGRTDGALVRLVTPVLQGESTTAAEARLTDFARALPPVLEPHLPAAPGLIRPTS